jgi:IMP cyclohydrolase
MTASGASRPQVTPLDRGYQGYGQERHFLTPRPPRRRARRKRTVPLSSVGRVPPHYRVTVSELREVLHSRTYPGRGLLAVRLPDERLYVAYFLTGRSAASRSRVLETLPSGGVQVKDTSGGHHDDLRHYVPAVHGDQWTVIGNGDQVEPLSSALESGLDPASAWSAHTYEPDPPIFTPRIWLAVRRSDSALIFGSARMSERSDGSADRLLWTPEALPVGEGVLMTTYEGTAERVATSGTPVSTDVSHTDRESLLDGIWGSLEASTTCWGLRRSG